MIARKVQKHSPSSLVALQNKNPTFKKGGVRKQQQNHPKADLATGKKTPALNASRTAYDDVPYADRLSYAQPHEHLA